MTARSGKTSRTMWRDMEFSDLRANGRVTMLGAFLCMGQYAATHSPVIEEAWGLLPLCH
jgi:hypothetical protein